MKSTSKASLLVIAILITGLLLTGCYSDDDPVPNGEENGENGENGEVTTEETSLYFMKITETDFATEEEIREIEAPVTPEKVGAELMKGPDSEDLDRVIPEDTELLGVEVVDGIAYVDFSDEIVAGQYGSAGENVLITSIVLTFTDLPEVDAVQILVEGEEVESIGGHIVISEPLSL